MTEPKPMNAEPADAEPVARKMNIKPAMNGIVLNKPEGVSIDSFGFESSVQLDAQPDSPLDFIIMFAMSTMAELERNASQAVNLMGDDTRLWVGYPKKPASPDSDIPQIDLDANWTLIRFKYRRDEKMLARD